MDTQCSGHNTFVVTNVPAVGVAPSLASWKILDVADVADLPPAR
jgi:hypothetical protein